MKYTGRIISMITLFMVIIIWHSSYFLIDTAASFQFFIVNDFLKYDFIYTPLLVPFMWWLGTQYDKATYYSAKDILTGVYNRRYVQGTFPKFTALSLKNRKKISLSIVDIDNFKMINDRFGHDAGDRVLQHIAKALTQNTRKSDIIARWGGDEFLVIVASSDQYGLQRMDHRLEYKLNGLSINESVPISISVGSAVYPDDADNLHDLIKRADENMYWNKMNGQLGSGNI